MDRPGRFTNGVSKFNDTPYTPTTPGTRSHPPAPLYQDIDLDDVQDWTKRNGWPTRTDTQNVEEWRQRAAVDPATVSDNDVWPRFTVDQDTAPIYGVPEKKSAADPGYDRSFLHPPTPGLKQPSDEHFTAASLPRRMSSLSLNIEQSSRFGWWTLALLLITVVMVTMTAVYANGSAKALMRDKFFTTSPSNAILILRILTEACALLFAALIVVVVEDLQWALASRPGGVSLLHFVGLDSGTGVWGLLRLLATADWKQKYSSLFRLMVLCTIPLPGIVLMGDVNLELVFFPEDTYDVAAGIDQFNASYINDVDDTIVTALLVQMGSPSWSSRETWSMDPLGPNYGKCTVSATDTSWTPCAESHLLTGGALSVSPQRDNMSFFTDSTAYVVPRTRSLQLEYGGVHNIEHLYENGTCYTVGAAYAAAYWCAATGDDHELLFGSSYCPLAVQSKQQCLNDSSWTSPLQTASSLFVYKRYATVNYDRSNFSILSVTDLTEPQRELVILEDYMTALSAVVPGFKVGNTTNSTKGDNSALAIYAVTALPINDNEVAKRMSLAAIRKAMSVPFTYFQANYFSTESIWELNKPRSGLSKDMYTIMSLSVMSYQVVAGKISRWLFGLLCGMLLALSAATIIITARLCRRVPQRCGYPTLDFAAVCAVKGGIPRPPSSSGDEVEVAGGKKGSYGLHRSLTSLGQEPGPFQVASRIKHERIVLGR